MREERASSESYWEYIGDMGGYSEYYNHQHVRLDAGCSHGQNMSKHGIWGMWGHQTDHNPDILGMYLLGHMVTHNGISGYNMIPWVILHNTRLAIMCVRMYYLCLQLCGYEINISIDFFILESCRESI